MQSQPYGLSPVELNLIYVTFGAGKPITYSETGMEVSALFGHTLKQVDFWPRFLKTCAKGMVSFQGWDDLAKHKLARVVVSMPKCVEVIRDVQIAQGGDYSYYKYFDPYENYEKNPEKLDRFLKGPVKAKGGRRNMSKEELFKAQFESHKKDPKKFRWF